MTNNAARDYVWDLLLRSFEDPDAIREDLNSVERAVQDELLAEKFGKKANWEKLYGARCQRLLQSVTLCYQGSNHTPDSIIYHPRFGWVLRCGESATGFLGKVGYVEQARVEIGIRSYLSGPGRVRGNGLLSIGNFTSIGEGIYITLESDSHPFEYTSTFNLKSNARVIEDGIGLDLEYTLWQDARSGVSIGHDVWIGRNVRIGSGVSIGNGCVIAENAVVKKDCKAFGVYAGDPASLIRYRFSETRISELESIAWWNWPLEKIQENTKFFDTHIPSVEGALTELVS